MTEPTELFEPLIDIKVAKKLLSSCESTIYHLISAGEIPHYKLNRSVRFRVSELEKWIQNKSRNAAVQGDNSENLGDRYAEPKIQSTDL